jgi:hypothetical protein
MTEDQARFYDSFRDHMSQYPLTVLQFVHFLNDRHYKVPSETSTALYDAMNMWHDATTGEKEDE